MMATKHPRPILWKDQDFHFPEDPSEITSLVLHLNTFPSNLALKIRELDGVDFTRRPDGKWSIQEHLGHLIDLDQLPLIRIDEILRGEAVMTPADMDNQKTWDQNYNEQSIFDICEKFIESRKELVRRFIKLNDDELMKFSRHERLDRNMSILDLAYFQACHDRYHEEMILFIATS